MLKEKSSITVTFIASLSGTAVFSIYLGLTDGYMGLISASLGSKVIIIYIGILATGFTYTVRYHLLRRMDALKVGIFAYLIPVFAAVLSIFILGEQITAGFVIGMVLIFIGIRFVQV